MQRLALLLLCFLPSTIVSAFANDPSELCVGNWSSKRKSEVTAEKIAIVHDDKDIKAKFFGKTSQSDNYLGEGIAEWYPDKNGRGAYITNFVKDGARMQVVLVPNSKHTFARRFLYQIR